MASIMIERLSTFLRRGGKAATQAHSPKKAQGQTALRQRDSRSASMREAWRRSRAGLAVVFLLTAFINLLKLAIPLYIFQLLDRVVASGSVETLVLLTAIAVFSVLTAAFSEVLRKAMLNHWGGWIERHFGQRLFVASLNRRKVRSPGKAIDDLETINGFVSGPGATTWLDAIWAPAFLFVVYLIHPILGLIVLIGMLTMLGLGVLNELLTRQSRAQMHKANRRSEAWLSTAEQQLETVASLNIGDRVASRWHTNATRRGVERRLSRFTGDAVNETMRFAEACQRIACYGVGVWLTIEGVLSVGGIIAGAVLGRLGTSVVRRAMANWRQAVNAHRAYTRVRRRLDSLRNMETAIRDPNAQLAIHLREMSFVHTPWSRPLFSRMNLSIQPGEMLCVIGPSGSGKTTFAMLVAGALQPTMGSVHLGSLDIARFSPLDRRRLIGYMPQSVSLLEGTIAENIASLGAADDRRLVAAAQLAGIHDVIAALPKGYETKVSNQKSPLSGGELRRLALARAIFGKPSVIVLDEPEMNLDDELIENLMGTLATLKQQGIAIVVTSQLKQIAELSDKILVLSRRGRPIAYPTKEAYGAAQTGQPNDQEERDHEQHDPEPSSKQPLIN